jgi:ribose 5-phosphate isomerase B
MPSEILAIAADHAGYDLKAVIAQDLEADGHRLLDLGTHEKSSVDYPDFADKLAAALREGRASRGVLICGTGIGISIAANRHRHIRCALCHDSVSARLARAHNDANVIALGARLIGVEVARDAVKVFLATAFEGGRHSGRVAKLAAH